MDDQAAEAMKAFTDFLKTGNFDKLTKDLKSLGLVMKTLPSDFKKTTASLQSLTDQIEDLDEQLEKMEDGEEKRELEKQKRDKVKAKNEQYAEDMKKARMDTAGKTMGAFLKGFTNSFTKATTSALAGGDALKISADFMESGIDTANNAVQAGASGIQGMGNTMTAAGNKWGVAVTALGAVAGMASNALSGLAKAGISFMLSQTMKMIDGFKQMSAVGAMFAGGMGDMVTTALTANMTLEQFSKSVADNREAFAKAGLTVAEGSKRMAAAMKAGGDSARNGMFALGMSIEEQADATAKTMQIMAGPTGRLKASNEEVAAQTAEYARNLKLISDITGEDVKTKQDLIRKENDTLFMNQQIARMSATERAKFNQMQMTMNETDRRALTEKMKYGSVVSADLAAASAMSPAIAKKWQDQYEAVKDGTMSTQKGLDIQSAASEEIRKNALSQTAISLATGGAVDSINKVTNEQLEYANKNTKEGKAAAEEALKLAQSQTGPGSAAQLMAIQQTQQVQMQAIANNNLQQFGEALATVTTEMLKAVNAFAKVSADTGTGIASWFAKHSQTLINTGMVAAGAALTATGIGEAAGIPLMTAGGTGLVSQLATGGFAGGGISSGSSSGYAAKLHGSELIVPMSGNTLDANSKGYSDLLRVLAPTGAAAASTSSNLNQQLLSELQTMNDYLSKQCKTVDDQSTMFRQLLDLNHSQLSVQNKTFNAVV